jgi:hypothetical protein
MTRRIQVTVENGAFVPVEDTGFPEHKKLTIMIDENFPDDPPPESGVELVDWVARHRIRIDPKMAHKIALSKAYAYYEEPDDD